MERNLPLYEKYRPQSWDEVVGQSSAMKKLNTLRQRGLGGRVFFITGFSGVGKTTIARLIAKELTLPYATYEMDAQRVCLADVREFDRKCRCKPLGGSYHVWIINEAHNMSGKVVSELQTVLESPHVQRNSTWAFTTTSAGERLFFDSKFDAVPFLSRAIKIELDGRGSNSTSLSDGPGFGTHLPVFSPDSEAHALSLETKSRTKTGNMTKRDDWEFVRFHDINSSFAIGGSFS